MTDISPAARADLASTAKLRAAINYGNFILATKDRATGESRGVAVDLTQELGRRLGVPVEIVAYDSVAVMGDAAPTSLRPASSGPPSTTATSSSPRRTRPPANRRARRST